MTQYSDEEGKIPLPESSSENESETSDNEISFRDSDQDQTSDSDSEPECFSFSATQESRKQSQKLATEAIKLQKDELKRKRKEVFLQNLKQREEKRQKLASKRLPDHVLESLDDELGTTATEDKTDEPEEPTEKKDKKTETEVVQTSGNITFKCKVLSSEVRKQQYTPKKVAHSKEQMLYGNRIKREKSTRHALLKREKQRLKK